MKLFEDRSTYDASLDPIANVTILIECHPSLATSVIDHIGKLEGKVYSANVSCETISPVKVEAVNVEQQVQRRDDDESPSDGQGSLPAEGGAPEVKPEHVSSELAGTAGSRAKRQKSRN
jgi:hypothetical protein